MLVTVCRPHVLSIREYDEHPAILPDNMFGFRQERRLNFTAGYCARIAVTAEQVNNLAALDTCQWVDERSKVEGGNTREAVPKGSHIETVAQRVGR